MNLPSLVLVVLFSCSSLLYAQESNSADELAKKLQNPVASLISVPFQFNYDAGIGLSDGHRTTINIQPVVPISLNEDWNLIGRVILPIVSQNNVFGESGSQSGLSDAVLSGFFSPVEPTSSGWIWGVGPVLLLPTASDDFLGADQFGIGPTAVALKQAGSLTIGFLINHVWSISGNEDRSDVNNTFLQPFFAKNFNGGYALTVQTELNQNWEAESSSGFAHLIGSKVIKIGNQLTQIAMGPRVPYGNGNTAEWGLRAQLVLLFPK